MPIVTKPAEDSDTDAFSDLLRDAQNGDEEARERLYRRYGRYVLASVRSLLLPPLRRRYDSMDLSQSVFAEVFQQLPRFEDRGEAAFMRWLAIKSHNKVRSKLRKNLGKNGERVERDLGELEDTQSSDVSPFSVAEAREVAARTAERVGELDETTREVMRLRWEEDLQFGEIAKRLRLPSADAARKKYARTLVRLQKGLADR